MNPHFTSAGLIALLLVNACTGTEFDTASCRVCSWHLTCQQLCETAGQQCSSKWEEAGDGTLCHITYQKPIITAAQEDAIYGSRMVNSWSTYSIHKDVLSDLLHRYNQVKRLRAHGGTIAGSPMLGDLETKAVGYSLALCFPRIALVWRWLTGNQLSKDSPCCHQECHWEMMLTKSATMPSLEELLAKSVEATIAVLGGHSTCGSSKKAGSFGSSATSGSSLSPSVLYASVPWSQRHQFAATTHAWGRAANTPEAAADLAATATDVFGAAAPGAQAVPTVGDADAAGQGLPQLDIMQGAGQGSDLGDDAGIDLEAASTWYGIHREHMAIRAQAQAYARSRPSASSNSLFDWSRPSETHSRLGMSSSHSHSARRRYSGPLGWLQPDAIVSWLVWLLAPGLLVAYDVMSLASSNPWVAVYVCAVAALHTAAEWRAMWVLLTMRSEGSVRDRAVSAVSGCLVMAVVVVMLTGFVTSWLPLLGPPASMAILWIHMLTLPLAAAWFTYALWGIKLGHSSSTSPSSGLFVFSSNAPTRHRAGRQQQAASGVGPVLQALQLGRLLVHDASPDAVAQFLQTHGMAVVQAEGRPAGSNRQDGMGGAGSAAAGGPRTGGRAAEGAAEASGAGVGVGTGANAGGGAAGGPQMATTGGGAGAGGQASRAAGRDRVRQAEGAQAAGGTQPAAGAGGAAGVLPGAEGGPGARVPTARQSAAAAALAAIHWPPPLDLPSWLEEECRVPDAFKCPITLSVMKEPTQASSGVTYERSAIFQWLHIHRVDPVTHVPLKRHRLTPNLNLRHMIEDWADARVSERRAQSPGAEQGSEVGDSSDSGNITPGRSEPSVCL